MKKIIIFVLVFGIFIALAGAWYWQRNIYSKGVLKLEILGPETTDIAQEIEYTVKYKNNGNITLEEPKLIFEFPEYSSTVNGSSRRKEIGAEELGDIYPGEEKVLKFKCRLFGKEGETKTAKAFLSYRPKNLKARFESSTTLTSIIKAVPLTFDFDVPSKVEPDRDFKLSLNYFSNLNYPLNNLGVKIEYPSDFEFLESSPKSVGKTEWEIPLLNKAEGGRIEIKGKISAGIKEQKIFRAVLGVWLNDEFISLKESSRGIEITKPSLFIFQRVNNSDEYIANPGDVLHYEVFFRNIGEEAFTDLFLVVTLEGMGFDLNSIKTDFGQFNKGDKSIMWDWRDVPKLRYLQQGEEGKVEFWLNTKSGKSLDSQYKNLSLKNSVLISRLRQEFEIKMNSQLVVIQKGYFNDEVFGNTGPIPPKVGQATTYTIIWQIKNYYNDLRNVKVKAVLPLNVALTGKISPESESSKFSFDNKSREAVWAVADSSLLTAGTGVLDNPPYIAFQISFIPTADQKSQTPAIIGLVKASGEDQWTGETIEGIDSVIDTTLPDDNSIFEHQGIVE